MWVENDTPVTWTCHACRDERPDELVGVYKTHTLVGQIEVGINRRYCLDRTACYVEVLRQADEQAERMAQQHAARQGPVDVRSRLLDVVTDALRTDLALAHARGLVRGDPHCDDLAAELASVAVDAVLLEIGMVVAPATAGRTERMAPRAERMGRR